MANKNNKIKNKYDDEKDAPITSSLALLFILVIPLFCFFHISNISSFILPVSYIVGMVLIVYSKVKYPTNKFTKGVFTFAMITLVFAAWIVYLIATCSSCPG